MTHPAPMGDHMAGHIPSNVGPGPEHIANSPMGYAPAPQWAPDPSAIPPSQPQPPYPPYPPYQPAPNPGSGYPQQYVPGMNPTNPFAIGSLVFSLGGWGPIAVILGHIALAQIKRANGYQRGHGIAVAGLIIGYIETALALAILVSIALGLGYFFANPTVVPSN